MIRAPGLPLPQQDPKLKLPPIGFEPARAVADAGETAALRKRLSAAEGALLALTARVAALEGAPADSDANKANGRREYQRDLMRKRRAAAKTKAST